MQTLGASLLRLGFSEEDANAEGVVVEEVPGPKQVDMPKHPRIPRGEHGRYLPYIDYNLQSARACPQLRACFAKGHQGAYGTLAHSHLLLVLLALSGGAEWQLPEGDALRSFMDQDGRWHWGKLQAADQALGALVREGLTVQVLSWELYRDDPDGAQLISAALNRGHNLSLKQSEKGARKGRGNGRGEASRGCAVAGPVATPVAGDASEGTDTSADTGDAADAPAVAGARAEEPPRAEATRPRHKAEVEGGSAPVPPWRPAPKRMLRGGR